MMRFDEGSKKRSSSRLAQKRSHDHQHDSTSSQSGEDANSPLEFLENSGKESTPSPPFIGARSLQIDQSRPITMATSLTDRHFFNSPEERDWNSQRRPPGMPFLEDSQEEQVTQEQHAAVHSDVNLSGNELKVTLRSLPREIASRCVAHRGPITAEVFEVSPGNVQFFWQLSDASNVYPCRYCKLTFYQPSKLKQHRLLVHHVGNKCRMCQAIFLDQQGLQEHIAWRHPQEVCIFCGIAFSSINSLASHVKAKHAPYKCKYCQAACISFADLQVHQRLHTNSCPHCFIQFASPNVLKVHMKTLHELMLANDGESSLKQEGEFETLRAYGAGSQSSDDSLDNSASNGVGFGSGPSNFSNMGLNDSYNIQGIGSMAESSPDTRAFNIVADPHGRYTCGKCRKSFKTAVRLGIHIKQRHENGGQGFYCSICDQSFANREESDAHRLEHRSNPSCHICYATFSSTSNLSAHIKRHLLNEKTAHQCSICDSTIDGPRKNLTAHMKDIHGVRLEPEVYVPIPDPQPRSEEIMISEQPTQQRIEGPSAGPQASEKPSRNLESLGLKIASSPRNPLLCRICRQFLASSRHSLMEHRWNMHRLSSDPVDSLDCSEDDEDSRASVFENEREIHQDVVNCETFFWARFRGPDTLGELTAPSASSVICIEEARRQLDGGLEDWEDPKCVPSNPSNWFPVDDPAAGSNPTLRQIVSNTPEPPCSSKKERSESTIEPLGGRAESKRSRKKRPYTPSKTSAGYSKMVKSMSEADVEAPEASPQKLEELAQLVTHGISPLPLSATKKKAYL